MLGWVVGGVGTFVVSLAFAWVFLKMRCRGVGPPFGPVQRHDVEWRNRISADTLIDLAASRSYIITRPAGERAAVLDAVRRLLDTHPALAGRAEIDMPYVTRCSRTFLAGEGPVSAG